ncbi:MAG: accessory gene regulator B family protein [Candidatus Coprovivens sp.]
MLEYFIIIISFFIMRQCFGKSYHADSVIKCTTLSLLVFVLATKLSMPIYLTILCNVLIGCLVAYIMHIWYYYIKYTSNCGITVSKGMSIEDLIELKNQYGLTELEFNILNDYYINRIKINDIAFKYEYSSDGIKKIKAKALNKITKQQN